ncbi:MAG: YigZ family protein [Bacteroidales bacterium]|nr:YigZ family protein [Bacteroidales bacterium]
MINADIPAKDTYLSIPAPAEGLFKDRGSRFIALARPVNDEEEAQSLLEAARKEYHDARHHCLAYRIGLGGGVWRASDDGEPSGSAGRPILGQIDSRNLSDVAVVVVRYFGGIKLGVPGLIRAYREATADALDKAGTVEKIAGKWVRLEFGYLSMNQVMKVLKDLDLPQKGQDFGQRCSLQARVRLSVEEAFKDRISQIDDCLIIEE